MKRLLLTTACALLVATGANAANHQQNPMANMSPQDAQKMQEAAMQIMKCVQDAGGQDMLQKISARSEEVNARLGGLCKAGKRDEAEQEAIAFGKKMSEAEDTKKLMKCGEMGQQMIESMNIKVPTGKDGKPLHVCDGYK